MYKLLTFYLFNFIDAFLLYNMNFNVKLVKKKLISHYYLKVNKINFTKYLHVNQMKNHEVS